MTAHQSFVFCFVLVVATLIVSVTAQDEEICAQDIDLVFALDASGSVEEAGFEKIKNFTKDIIDQFEISVSDTHVGIVTFSEYAEVQLRLTESFDKKDILKKIDELDYPGYRTATDDALRVVDRDVLSISGGARQGVAQVLIFLTDGKCTVCTESIEKVVTPLKDRGVTIYTIGVTDNINQTELEIIASRPTKDYSFQVSDFNELASIIVDVYSKACSVKKGKCAKPLSPFQCNGTEVDKCIGDIDCEGEQKCCSAGCFKKCSYPLLNCMTAIDIAFAIDSSRSVRDKAFVSMKTFAKDIVDSFTVSQKDARFASLTYSDDAEVNFDFVRHSSADKIKRAIDALPHKKSNTRVDKALELAGSDIFSLQGGVRTRRPMVLIVFFDGDISKDMKDLKNVVAPLKDYGVKIVAIGVGPEVNSYQLNKIASSKDVVFKARAFNDLLPELYSIAEETCNKKPGQCIAEQKSGSVCVEGTQISECINDFDCFGTSKCCNDGCSSICVLPVDTCKRKLDIAFALHQNVAEEEFNIMQYFVRDSLQRFEISDAKSHSSLITFGNQSEVVFDFNADQDLKGNLMNKIDQLSYKPGQGSLVDVLTVACEQIFCVVGGTRTDVPKVLVLVTGSLAPSDPEELSRRIRTLRSVGVDILIIGVGEVDTNTLQKVTSDKSGVVNRVFLAKNYNGILQYGQDIPDFACLEAGSLKPDNEVCETPTSCVKGVKGSRGQNGRVGERGPQGPRGSGGSIGIKGPHGEHGEDGKRGAYGDQGGQGLKGLPGFAGYNGLPGVSGVQGSCGRGGDCGIPGAAGDAGVSGVDGFSGPPGYKGPAGPKGRKGEPAEFNPNLIIERGDDGEPGVDGVLGRKGMKGDEGIVGGEGDDAIDGKSGDVGEAGERGDPGVVTNSQKGKVGEPGDHGDPGPPGIDYAKGGSLNDTSGPPGDQGKTGERGDVGDMGIPANQRGATGAQGKSGLKGDKGIIGDASTVQGAKGAQGKKGLPGVTGGRGDSAGVGRSGFPGMIGEAGAKGFQGEQGRRGDSGKGIAGEQGKKGPAGDNGLDGTRGTFGSEGAQGVRGEDGDDGIMGPVGEEGGAGAKGQDGPVGQQGEPGSIGDIGAKGAEGVQGPKGDAGEHGKIIEGDVGIPGTSGAKGVNGAVGPPGSAGPQGPESQVKCIEDVCPKPTRGVRGGPGENGDIGGDGPSGPLGPKGHPGGPCPTCPAGAQGISGDAGFPGQPGSVGEAGKSGDVGAIGIKGKRGLPGPSGEQGPKGIRGSNGEIGKNGPVGPDSAGDSVAERGDKGKPGSDGANGLRGPTGPKGENGTNGSVGERGRRGDEGLKGISGESGKHGINGKDGVAGQPGEVGESSTAGEAGHIGSVGQEGEQGAAGKSGMNGKKGEQGQAPTDAEVKYMRSTSQGDSGPDGSTGEIGGEGVEGQAGPRGPQGEQGKQGERGSGGPIGGQGAKGRAGDDGPPGENGRPGTSGKRGDSGEPGKAGLAGDLTIKGEKGDRGDVGPDGRKGKDAKVACITDDRFDIAILLDSSKSVTEEDFNRQKEFIREIIKEFPIGLQDSLVGVVKYGSSANMEIRFNDFVTSDTLADAVGGLRYNAAQESRLDLALKMAQDDLFTKKSGSRVGDSKTKKALVILGDGFISGGGLLGKELSDNALKYAKAIQEDEDVLVFSLAVGSEKNKYLLQEFVTDPKYYLDVPNYDFLSQKIEDLKAALSIGCKNATVQKGEKGRDGVKGAPGDAGKAGEPGPPGAQGPDGLSGAFGTKGLNGEEGENIKGETGFGGLPGVKGEAGLPGLNGETVKGEPGSRGLTGEAGVALPGPEGLKGEQGPVGPAGPDADQKLCDNVLATDVIFIIDTSIGVGKQNFDKMKVFMKSIVKSFDVDNQLTRVGVMTYDVDVRLDIKLSDHNNVASLFTKIDDLVYVGGESTRIDKALLAVDTTAYSESNGGRDDVNRAIVLMTDGQQSYAQDQVDIPDAVKPLIDGGVLRYAIGIGAEISSVELEAIAGDNVVLADDFDSLINKIETQIKLIGKRGCKGGEGAQGGKGAPGDGGYAGLRGQVGEAGLIGAEGRKGLKGVKGERGISQGSGRKGFSGDLGDAGPPGLPGCNGDESGSLKTHADIGFVMDASASLYKKGFQEEIDFVNKIIDAVGPVSRDGVRVSVIVYSVSASLRIKFDDYLDSELLKDAVSRLPYDDAGETRIDLGLEKAKEMFKEENGARGSSKKVLVLMTDGQQTYIPDIKDPSEMASDLIEDGIEILAVGIGEEIARVDLESYISKPELLFLASDFDSLLNQLVGEVSQALTCEGGPRGPTGQVGDDGAPGDQGSVGPLGDIGKRGEPGDAGFGPTGTKGEKGIKGPKGVIGEEGYRGADGPLGPRGPIGSQGSVGPSGMKGDTGSEGFVGLGGPAGPPGPKGPVGDSSGTNGAPGKKGEVGEQGNIGEKGDPGVLRPGSVIGDLKGGRGIQGPTGVKGVEGPKGRLLVAPGPIGTQGEPGEPGDSGQFGDMGDSAKGPRGPKGEAGAEGLQGDKGDTAFAGFKGSAGTDGDPGSDGRTFKGDVGENGESGLVGETGKAGEPGWIGLMGLFGRKGDRGEAGKQGPAQLPDPNQPIKFKGKKGDQGELGEAGPTGGVGAPGPGKAGPQGPSGEQGERGVQGPDGERGEAGLFGIEGLQGLKGEKGRVGEDGNPGGEGRRGRVGEPGPLQPKGSIGDIGSVGDIGLIGRPGIKGSTGIQGGAGGNGSRGSKGIRGPAGFNGLTGQEGNPGPLGEKGLEGDIGTEGLEGLPGPVGDIQTGAESGYYVVRHSQNSYVPTCPRDYEVMWEGYSLMYTVGNGHAHSQDLGDAGSCSRSFSTMPFIFCDITNSCKYASRNDFTYWLSGDVRQPMMPVTNSAVEPFISRCAVCKAPDISIAVHSQDVNLPSCPGGYDSLWSGFSFLMVAAAGSTGAGQSLGSSGSCLEEFRPKPFIECEGARGTCHFFSDKFSFWLVTINKAREFDPQTPVTLNKNKGDVLTSRVSKCRVCIRKSPIDSGNVPEAGGFFRRVARSVGGWLSSSSK